jgi:hypothetical protein
LGGFITQNGEVISIKNNKITIRGDIVLSLCSSNNMVKHQQEVGASASLPKGLWPWRRNANTALPCTKNVTRTKIQDNLIFETHNSTYGYQNIKLDESGCIFRVNIMNN